VVDNSPLAALVLALCESLRHSSHHEQLHAFSALSSALLSETADERDAFSYGEHRAISLVRRYLCQPRIVPPTMKDMAQLAGLSRFHLSRLFRDAVGLSPYAYFSQVRLARAQYLLHVGASVTRAAAQLGFTDQSHLTRQFRGRLTTTPGRYARAVRGALAAGGGPLSRNATASKDCDTLT
jgi:AraC-like DNA-binding protein